MGWEGLLYLGMAVLFLWKKFLKILKNFFKKINFRASEHLI